VCGICGIVGAVNEPLLRRMADALRHRGPDDVGFYLGADPADGHTRLALGMRRLSIIDLTPAGHQPMSNEDGTVWIVFNGEIYNFKELRADLEKKGHRFKSRTDTEVIVHLYEEMGEECVHALRGMFAFAVWDLPRGRLLLARDRLGKKPLHYCVLPGALAFASEIKALLEHPSLSREIDPEALDCYLTFGYVPHDLSIFRQIKKLLPGHTLVWERGTVTVSRYWDLAKVSPAPPPKTSFPEAYYLERTHDLLRESVRLRLVSDVPLGIFLSGGIDSSAIVAMMRELSHDRIATFSLGFGQDSSSYNELDHARLVAKHFDTQHHEYLLEPNIVELLPLLVRHFDEPFADSSALLTFLVSKMARREVTVALSGIGGDEAFGGYPRYLGASLSLPYGRLPCFIRNGLGRISETVLRETHKSRNLGGWGKRFFRGGMVPLPERYVGWLRLFDDRQRRHLYAETFKDRLRDADPSRYHHSSWGRGSGDDPLQAMFYTDLTNYLPDDLLTMGDRMSMANSLELRTPFCDHKLVEFAWQIPSGLKLKHFRLKYLLKRALHEQLPPQTLRRRKQGFMVPLGQWLQKDLRDMVETFLSSEVIRKRGYFNPEYVAWLIREHHAGKQNFSDQLWALMVYEVWHRIYVDNEHSLMGTDTSHGREGSGEHPLGQ